MAAFVEPPAVDAAAQALFDRDVEQIGFVMNASRVWSHQPDAVLRLFELLGDVRTEAELSMRDMGILIAATASTLGDSYCSLAWGMKLAERSDADTAAAVLTGDDDGLTAAEAALAAWARRVVADPNATTEADVQQLRDLGYSDRQVFAATVIVGLRLAYSTINDALGATPDEELLEIVPEAVQQAVTFGRPVDGGV